MDESDYTTLKLYEFCYAKCWKHNKRNSIHGAVYMECLKCTLGPTIINLNAVFGGSDATWVYVEVMPIEEHVLITNDILLVKKAEF